MDILLLYALLKWDKMEYSDDFAFYMRHIRNYLIKKGLHTRFDSVQLDDDLELSKLDDFDMEINRIKANIIAPSREREIIEDIEYVRGNLIPQVLKVHNYDSALKNAFELFYQLTDDEKRKVLIANGFTGIRAKDCAHGHCCFFGDEKRYSFIFMLNQKDASDTLSRPFNSFVDRVSNGESPQDQILNSLKTRISNKQFDFIYYALRYESFLKVRAKTKRPTYYLSINGDINNLDIVGLGNYSQTPLRSYHADPFAYTIAQELIGSSNCPPANSGKCYYVAYSTIGNNPADLWIYDSKDAEKPILTVHHNPTKTMEFKDANGLYPLSPNPDQDLIEQSIKGIRKILSPCTFEEK